MKNGSYEKDLTIVLRCSSCGAGLVMNVIPGHLVVPPSGSGHPNGENEPLVKRSLQQLEHLVALLVVWQVRLPVGAVIRMSRSGMLLLQKEMLITAGDRGEEKK